MYWAPLPFVERAAQPGSLVLVLAALCVFASAAHAYQVEPEGERQTVVRGQVADARGDGVPYANIQIAGTAEGTASDRSGRFQLHTRLQGEVDIQASAVGYEVATQQVVLGRQDTVTVDFALRGTVVELGEATVSASSYTVGDAESVTLNMLDVVTTPGTSADIYRTVQTFPGVTSVDGGSSLFVRGGDVSETVTLLDQATVAHPYRFESPTTSTFGTVPPFLVDGLNFTSGGYSAKYGNALSAVLAMDSRGLPEADRYYGNLSLAATSAGVDLSLVDGALGVRASGNQSFTGMLFRLNGHSNEFSLTPRSTDANLSLIYEYSDTGQLKLFNYRSSSRMGVRVDDPDYSRIYRTESTNWLHNLQWSESLYDWNVQTSLSMNRYASQQQYGELDLRPSDTIYKLRTDVTRELGRRFSFLTGGEVQRTVSAFEGSLPGEGGEGHATALDERFPVTRSGAYAEVESHLYRRFIARLGVRTDYHSASEQFTADPRFALRYVASARTDVHLSWGIFHQFAAPFNYSAATGNPELNPQRAQHFIAGVMHERDRLLARVEAYYKPYDDLVLGDPGGSAPTEGLTNRGEGWSRGVDVFLKYGQFLQTRFYGRASYSYLQSQRLQLRRLGGEGRVYEQGPSPFDITHNLSVVANATLVNGLGGGVLSGGGTLRHATGQPHTPIVGAEAVSGGYYAPVEGPVGSERLPAFRRVDAQLNYYLPFGEGHSIVFYASVNNVLSRTNVLGYEYAADYSARTAQEATLQRSFYFGVNVNFLP